MINVGTHDVITRRIRIRPGPGSPGSEPDGVWVNGDAYNVIFDHCSISWAVDENLTASYGAHDVTIQWCIISQALCEAGHSKGWHSMGLMFSSSNDDQSQPQNLCVDPPVRDHLVPSAFPMPSITTLSALDAYDKVLTNAGVTVPVRDAVDNAVVQSVQNNLGGVIDDPSDVGGWPTLAAGTPLADTDHDLDAR